MNAEQLRLNARVEDEHWWFVGRRRIMLELVERVLQPDPQTTVVDVGCGTGANIAALSGRYRAVGIDTSPDAIQLARERFGRVEFIQGFAPQDLGPAAAAARLFLMMDVLEHVRDDFALLSDLLAAASPGALFLLTVPANPAMWSPQDESHLHYRRYELPRFRRLWEGLPVTPLLVSHFNRRLYGPIRAIRYVNRLRGKASGEAGTDLFLPARPLNRLLTGLFAGESQRLLRQLARGDVAGGGSSGVSLIALLRREGGPSPARSKPADVAPDLYDPSARRIEPAAV